jgi:hypothetical protein
LSRVYLDVTGDGDEMQNSPDSRFHGAAQFDSEQRRRQCRQINCFDLSDLVF